MLVEAETSHLLVRTSVR